MLVGVKAGNNFVQVINLSGIGCHEVRETKDVNVK